MKRKIFSVLFALVLVCSFGLVAAVPVAADYATFDNPDYYYAIVKEAPAGTKYASAGLSPDGTQIVAQMRWVDTIPTYTDRSEVVLMNADGSNEITISGDDSGTGDIPSYGPPFWSDDGTAIGFVERHTANPNKVISYDVALGTRTYIYEPTSGLPEYGVCNPDFLGASTTSIVFWDLVGGAADLFIWDGTTLTNITNSSDYKEYEPVSNADGTVIVYWSGEAAAEPINTTHTLTESGGTWTKDVGFTPIPDTYWAFWSGRADNYIGLTIYSTKDVAVYDSTGAFVMDLTGPGYEGGAGQWNFFGSGFEGPHGEFVMTSNARTSLADRDIVFVAPRAALFVDEDWYRTDETVYVTVEDAFANDPLRTDEITVKAISDYDVTGISVNLQETGANTGVFEGSFLLVPPPSPPEPTPEEVMVEDGDLITVTYLGVTDTARVDDTHPMISNFSPADGTTVTDAKPVISATLADDASGIDINTGEMTIDGLPVGAIVTASDISFTPADALAEGEHIVTVDVSDVAGNAATQAEWSFTVDTGIPGVTSVLLNPDPPYTEAGGIYFYLSFDEPMDASVLPTVTFGLLTPFDTHPVTNIGWSTDEGVWYWGGMFTIPSWGPALDGEQTLSVTGAQDLAGNVMLPDTSTTFVIDLNAPIPPDYILAFVNQNPPGIADSVQGNPGAVEGGALVEVWDDAIARDRENNLIGKIDATVDGDFDPISIGDNQHGTIWVTAMDAVGHRSAATVLYNDIDGPLITSGTWSVNAGQPDWVLEGQVIDVTIIGEPGCTATFDIGEIAVGVSAPEIYYGAGIYTGSYTVLDGDDVKNAPMQYHLTDAVGNIYLLGILMGPSIDTVVPTIDTLTPADGTFVDTATPEISAALDDNLSGVDQTSIVMTVSGATGSVTYSPSTPTGGIVYFYPDSDLAEGVHTVTLDVSDFAGNAATQASWSFTVDTIDPIITIDPITTPTDVGLQEIKGTFTEVNLWEITLAYNGYGQIVYPSGPNWAVPTFVHLNEGDNLIVATITDLAGNSAFAEATVNLDTQAPVVTVTSPNGGESLLGGNMYNITWTALDANFITDPIAIEYSVDSGTSWNDVATSEANDGGYLWTVPELDSSDCLIRVTGTDSFDRSSSDVSDAVFTITTSAPDTIAPAVTVNSPNGGEIWQGGSTQTITWTATDDKTPGASLLVELAYSPNGGTNWLSIATSQVNNGAYSWPVPEINSSQCLVKVEVSDASGNVGFDVSDRVFTISPVPTPPEEVTTIDLKTGWNLISLPLIPDDASIDVVLSGVGDISNIASVYYWYNDGTSTGWQSYVPGSGGTLTTMEDGKAYFIYMTGADTLTFTGTAMPAPPATPPTYDVYAGWNFIGFKSVENMANEVYLNTLITSGLKDYSILYGYDNTTGYFRVSPSPQAHGGADPGDMEVGYGYWLWLTTSSGTITP